jgi:arginyl-tRNA synthetase
MRAEDYIKRLLRDILLEKGLQWPDKAVIEPPRDKRFGDVACNVALVCAAQAGCKPRDLADELSTLAMQRGEVLDKVETAGPGFLNFTFTPLFWQRTVNDVLDQAGEFGRRDVGRGRRVQVEYVSANPTGPLHVGHGRGAALGDSLARILRFAGYDVATEYYINDAGRQMLMLGASVLARCKQQAGHEVDFPEDGYQGDYISDIAADILRERPDLLEALSYEQALAYCQERAVAEIMAGIQTDLNAFSVEHQFWFSEKSLVEAGAVEKTLVGLQERGLAFEEDGALWFRSTTYGDDKDRVLRKSNDYLTYLASDIAYHEDKFNRGFSLLVDVWGADHHGYVPRLKAAVQALGRDAEDFQVVLVQLVNLLRGGEPVAMSTRSGTFVTLKEVVDEVGADAARFMFLSRRSDSPLDFDLEVAKQQSMENPVYYVQYAHARICSLMRKAEERGLQLEENARGEEAVLSRLDSEEDMILLRHLTRFGDAIEAAARGLSPHFVSYYLQELAGAVHRYYTVHQVLAASGQETVRARLLLMAAAAQVVRNGLALLGVSAPRGM